MLGRRNDPKGVGFIQFREEGNMNMEYGTGTPREGGPVDREQVFWDAYRRPWRAQLATWTDERDTRAWTRLIIESAKNACRDYAAALGREVVVGCEGYGRLDVHAADGETGDLLVAFESELAPWGWNGSSGKDWREEFPKLGGHRRVLSGWRSFSWIQGWGPVPSEWGREVEGWIGYLSRVWAWGLVGRP